MHERAWKSVLTPCCRCTQDGESPSIPHFVQALYGLCSSRTKCYVSSEHRSSEVRSGFVEQAQKLFSKVGKEGAPDAAVPHVHLAPP
jgi:hypothetical protein